MTGKEYTAYYARVLDVDVADGDRGDARHGDLVASRGRRLRARAQASSSRNSRWPTTIRRTSPRAFRRGGLRRASAGAPDRRDARDHQGGDPRRGVGALPRALRPRGPRASPPPGGSSTTRCAGSRPRRSRAADGRVDARAEPLAAARDGRGSRHPRAGVPRHRPRHRAGAHRGRHARVQGDRRPPRRARRLQHDPRRGDVVAAVPGDAREARPRVHGVLLRVALARRPACSACTPACSAPKRRRGGLPAHGGARAHGRRASRPGSSSGPRARSPAATVLRLEDSYSRMSRLGKAELVFGELWSIGEALDQVRAVTADDVAAVAAELASRDRAVVVRVGPRVVDAYGLTHGSTHDSTSRCSAPPDAWARPSCRAVEDAPRPHPRRGPRPGRRRRSAAVDAKATVAVDFTVPDSTEANVHALIDAGIHAVVGTSGWTEEAIERVRDHLLKAPRRRRASSPRTSRSARYSPCASRPSRRRTSSPSRSSSTTIPTRSTRPRAPPGTRRPASPRRAATPRATRSPTRRTRTSTGRAAPTSTASRSTRSGCAGRSRTRRSSWATRARVLTIRHDSFDRESFMPGVLLGIRQVGAHPGLIVGLDAYLDV